MGKTNQGIEVILRVRPCKKPSQNFQLDEESKKVHFNIPKESSGGYVNNKEQSFSFGYN